MINKDKKIKDLERYIKMYRAENHKLRDLIKEIRKLIK